MKTCNTCNETLPLESFGIRTTGSRDGRAGWCFDCARDYHRNYYRNNPKRIRAIQKRHREANREQYLAYQKYATESRKNHLASR